VADSTLNVDLTGHRLASQWGLLADSRADRLPVSHLERQHNESAVDSCRKKIVRRGAFVAFGTVEKAVCRVVEALNGPIVGCILIAGESLRLEC